MKTDIQNRSDIEHLVNVFYQKILEDPVIGFIFNESIDFIWDEHIPKIYDFWDSVLFHTATYKGNPMLTHIALNRKTKLTEKHFERWVKLWKETIEENFQGVTANVAYEKAILMKNLMLHKIKMSSDSNFIQ